MKQLKQILLLCLIWMTGMSAWAEDPEYDFSYTYEGVTLNYKITSTGTTNAVKVVFASGYTSTQKDLFIPAKVSNGGVEYSVTAIDSEAFIYGAFTSVTIPNTVKTIGDFAFQYCVNIESATIPNSVTSIGSQAFSGCSRLTSVTMPNSVMTIEDNAFYGCPKITTLNWDSNVSPYCVTKYCYDELTTVNLGNNITTIGEQAFSNCKYLTSVTIPNSVKTIGKQAFERCVALKSITIPNSVKLIGDIAFSYCSSLKSLSIPNSVTTIEDYAFYACPITSLTIPYSVTSIGDNTFRGCPVVTLNWDSDVSPYFVSRYAGEYIESVTLGNNMTTIGDDAFRGCANLHSVTIPDNITTIGDNAFAGSSLTELYVPNSVTAIGNYAFWNCISLWRAYLGNSVESIGEGAFNGCESLTEVSLGKSLKTIGAKAFADTNVDEVVLPNSVKTIGNYAFMNCENLEKLNIGNSVKTIGSEAFKGCSNLTHVILPSTVTTIGASAFQGCGSAIDYLYFNCSTIIFKGMTAPSIGTDALDGISIYSIFYPNGGTGYDASWTNTYKALICKSDFEYEIQSDPSGVLTVKDEYKELFVTDDLEGSYNFYRTFNDHEWQTWCLPGEIDFDDIAEKFEVAEISWTMPYDGAIKVVPMRENEGRQMHACCQYLIRLKDEASTGQYQFTTTDKRYTNEVTFTIGDYLLKSTYKELSGAELEGKYILRDGKFRKAGKDDVLRPFNSYFESIGSASATTIGIMLGDHNFIATDKDGENIIQKIQPTNSVTIDDTYKGLVVYQEVENVNVTYNRTFKYANWLPWFVPFDMPYTDELASEFSFAALAGALVDSEDGQIYVSFSTIKPGKVIKGNTVYMVKSASATKYATTPKTFSVDGTTLHKTNNLSPYQVQSADYNFTFNGFYEPKTASADDMDWYYYNTKFQYCAATATTKVGAFRFVFSMAERSDSPYLDGTLPSTVGLKVDMEDVTAIEEISENADTPARATGVFNINGEKVANNKEALANGTLPAGIYVIDGKKVFIK